MRLSAAGAVFIAVAMVATAIGVIASHTLAPGFARLADDGTSSPPAKILGHATAERE